MITATSPSGQWLKNLGKYNLFKKVMVSLAPSSYYTCIGLFNLYFIGTDFF